MIDSSFSAAACSFSSLASESPRSDPMEVLNSCFLASVSCKVCRASASSRRSVSFSAFNSPKALSNLSTCCSSLVNVSESNLFVPLSLGVIDSREAVRPWYSPNKYTTSCTYATNPQAQPNLPTPTTAALLGQNRRFAAVSYAYPSDSAMRSATKRTHPTAPVGQKHVGHVRGVDGAGCLEAQSKSAKLNSEGRLEVFDYRA